MHQLLGVYKNFGTCYVSKECFQLQTEYGKRDYSLTHQALYFLLGETHGMVYNPEYYNQTSTVDECTFCITFSFKAEGYTESALIHSGCLAVIFMYAISRMDITVNITCKNDCTLCILFCFGIKDYTENTFVHRRVRQ